MTINYSLSFNIMSQLTLVEGFYTLQAQLHGYDNPNQVRVTGCNNNGCSTACCDNTGTCTSGFRRCDTFFIFCLRPFESGAPFGCGSSSGSEMQSTVSINGATIDFSQSTFLGLHNPLVFQGLTNAWNVSHSAVSLSQALYFTMVFIVCREFKYTLKSEIQITLGVS